MQRPIVVLPLPDSPTRATHRPGLDARTRRRGPRRCGVRPRPVLAPRGRRPRAAARRRRPGSARPRRPPAGLARARARSSGRSGRRGRAGHRRARAPPRGSAPPAYPQRGANAQPAGHSPTPTDTPGIPCSARGRRKSGIAADQRARVRVPGPLDHLVGRPVLDHPAGVHDHDPVGHPGDDGEVVRDVHHRHPLLVAQARELGQDAVLGEHVEPGGRLVEHGDRRLADARHRDRHALLLAARELVRVAAAEARIRRPARPARAPRAPTRRRRTPTRCARSTSMIASPTRSEGLSAPPGSCGTYETTRPRRLRSARASRPIDAAGRRPRSCRSRDDDARAGVAEQRERGGRLAAARTRRPGPGSRPAPTAKLTSSTTGSPRARGPGTGSRPGSRARRRRCSRRHAPGRLGHVRAAEAAGDRVARQVDADREQRDHRGRREHRPRRSARCTARFSLIMSAQSELGGCSPRPRKLTEAMIRIE